MPQRWKKCIDGLLIRIVAVVHDGSPIREERTFCWSLLVKAFNWLMVWSATSRVEASYLNIIVDRYLKACLMIIHFQIGSVAWVVTHNYAQLWHNSQPFIRDLIKRRLKYFKSLLKFYARILHIDASRYILRILSKRNFRSDWRLYCLEFEQCPTHYTCWKET